MKVPRLREIILALLIAGCASTEIVESPKTAFVPDTGTATDPSVIWTSRTLTKPFDYLGIVKTRAWTYDGGLQQLVEGGKSLRADAMIDVHYQQIGFLATFQGFAIKYK